MIQFGKVFFIACIVVVFSAWRCTLPLENSGKKEIRILSYNVENIFDDVDNGTEYAEFDPVSGGWNESLYHLRLVNLAEVIKAACRGGPDIIALQEIENEKVAADLVSLYLKGMGYTAVAVTKKSNSAVQVGIISRLPFVSVTVHDVYGGSSTHTRPVLEAAVKTEAGVLYILNNHWKSRIGGSRETEELRLLDASLVRKRMQELTAADPSADFLVVGDFNERAAEYEDTGGKYETALMPLGAAPSEGFMASLSVTGRADALTPENASSTVWTPWVQYTGDDGSYFYNGKWERIDQTFLSYGLLCRAGYLYDSFTVPEIPFIRTSEGVPLSWNRDSGSGYSDHLPILVTLVYAQQ